MVNNIKNILLINTNKITVGKGRNKKIHVRWYLTFIDTITNIIFLLLNVGREIQWDSKNLKSTMIWHCYPQNYGRIDQQIYFVVYLLVISSSHKNSLILPWLFIINITHDITYWFIPLVFSSNYNIFTIDFFLPTIFPRKNHFFGGVFENFYTNSQFSFEFTNRITDEIIKNIFFYHTFVFLLVNAV